MIITIAKDKLINGKKARVGDIFKYRDIYLKVIDTTNAEDECTINVTFYVNNIYKITNPDLYYKQKLRKDKLIEIGKHVE
jgi:hypothetical protein